MVLDKLYDLLKIFVDKCDYYELPYIIDGGTLLGAVRHNAIIPWDDDVDIIVFEEDLIKLHTLLNSLTGDIVWCKYKYGFKIFNKVMSERIGQCKKGTKILNYEWRYPFLDINIVSIYDARTHYIENYWEDNFYKLSEIYPLRNYNLGQLIVKGVNMPIQYLDRTYKSWDTIAWSNNYSHKKERFIKKEKMELILKDYRTPYL